MPTESEAKFQIGDRVKTKGFGRIGSITECHKFCYNVSFDDGLCSRIPWYDNELELISRATPELPQPQPKYHIGQKLIDKRDQEVFTVTGTELFNGVIRYYGDWPRNEGGLSEQHLSPYTEPATPKKLYAYEFVTGSVSWYTKEEDKGPNWKRLPEFDKEASK